jgi:hypothetical protein
MFPHDEPCNRRIRRLMHSVRTTCITSVRSSRSSCLSRRCCSTIFGALVLTIVLMWIGGTKVILPVMYPEQALWVENMCKIDVFTGVFFIVLLMFCLGTNSSLSLDFKNEMCSQMDPLPHHNVRECLNTILVYYP